MATVRELTTKLGFKVDEKDIDRAESRVKKMSNRMKVGITAALVGVFAIGKSALSTAADMETLNTQFEVMLGSAEAATKMMSDLREFSIKTPFETEDLAKSATTLLQFGLQADKVMGTLRMLGDVAGSDRERFKSLALVFGQIQSTGKLMGQDLLQLINQGFNPLTIISKATGKSVSDLKDEMSKGLISAEMVTEAFRIATAEGGLFFQNMQKQSLTLTGLLSTMRGAFKEVLVDIGNALMPLIKELTATLTELAKGGLRDLVAVLVKVLIPILKLLQELITPLVALITPLFDIFAKVLEPIVKIIKIVLIPAIELLTPVVNFLGMVLDSIGMLLEALIPLFEIIGEIFKAFIPILKPIMSLFAGIIRLLARLLVPVLELLAIVLMPLVPLLQTLTPLFKLLGLALKPLEIILVPIIKHFETLVGTLKWLIRFFKQLFVWIRYWLGLLGEVLGKLTKSIGDVLGDLFAPVKKVFAGLVDGIGESVVNVLKWIDNATGNLFTGIWMLITGIVDWINDMLDKFSKWFSELLSIFWKGPQKKAPIKVDVTTRVPNMSDTLKGASGSSKMTNVSMQTNVGITAKGGVFDAKGAKKTMEEAAKSVFSIQLQKLLINAGL